jgi:shikimate 5-dehydrogenase/3-dehydroquinate dehydratase/shikimate kinase
LGLIASGALQKEFVDYEEVFKAHTGQSSTEYLEARGFTSYRAVEDELTAEVCRTKRQGCVLVGFFVMPSNRQRKLLGSLAGSNPIIHIQRDLNHRSDKAHPKDGHLDQTHRMSDKLHRRFASYEFFNITQPATDAKAPGPLKLKGTEREFIRFLHRVLPYPETPSYAADLWLRAYTYALQVPTSWLDDPRADFTELDCGADAVSITIDATSDDQENLYFQLSRQIALLRKHSHVPVIIDLKAPATISAAGYVNLLELALRQAPDFIVISLDIDNSLVERLQLAKGRTGIVGKCHRSLPVSDNWNSKEWHDIYEKAEALKCSAVRLTGEAHYSHDSLESIRVMLEARRLGAIPTICYNFGQYGRSSVCLNSILSPVVLPSKSAGGVTLVEAQRALYSSFILPRKHFTVFGRTVSYSLSPAMHNAGYAACGMPHTCDFVQSDHVTQVHDLLKREDQGGFAVSLPYKTEIVPMMDEMSEDARIIGAVNTVVVDRVTTPNSPPRIYLKGFNTDHIGFRSCIERNLSPANAIRPQSSALIIGAGGMARAAIYACVQAGVKKICIFNRTTANAQRLADYFTAACPDTSLYVLDTLATIWPTHVAQPTIIISCIPTHEFAGNDAPDILIPEDWLNSPTGGVFVEVSVVMSTLFIFF